MPMITQMTVPTVLERMSISSNAPVGWPSSSVTTSRTGWTPIEPASAVRSTVCRVSASRSICSGAWMTRSSLVWARMRIRTGWSRSLVTVTANGPLSEESSTKLGASMPTFFSRASSQPVDASAFTCAEIGSSRSM